ncbi:MAG: hypothetical protein PHI97_28790 [Desulfobulbus sp.]|nr:hypothetical protein [Desulfobulbus sp.]
MSTDQLTDPKKERLARFGFAFPLGSPHVSRTYMLAELGILLEYSQQGKMSREDYIGAIVADNCLGKRTEKNRMISKRYLLELYSLDTKYLLFRALLFFWYRDPDGHPLLALLCSYCRDPLLRESAEFIFAATEGTVVTRQTMEEYLESAHPGRFSAGKRVSNAKNINSTWTQAGHLSGRTNKVRTRALPTAGNVSYALLLGYLTGVRGPSLFRTEYARLLDCSFEKAVELAEDASRKGWIVFKRVGDVIEVLFPNLISEQEMEWLRE